MAQNGNSQNTNHRNRNIPPLFKGDTKVNGSRGVKIRFSVKGPKGPSSLLKDVVLYGLVLILGLSVLASFVSPPTGAEQVPISTVLTQAKEGKISKITIENNKLTISYKDGKEATSIKQPGEDISTLLFSKDQLGLDPASIAVVNKDTSGQEGFLSFLNIFLPVIIMALFFLFIIRQARGAQDSIFSFGASKAKQFNKGISRVTFADVAGIDEAKKELEEVVDFLKNPKKYLALGARTPKGVLLVGPSGCGKTLLARAVAGEAGVPFFSMAGSEFMEMLVGVGASRVRDLFATAKKSAPSIIFIDEIDAIGRQRGMGLVGGHDERDQTLNQILVEMDGFLPNESVVVLAATNRPDILDPALVRPGRFDRRVVVDMPDIEGRKAILEIHKRGKPIAGDVDWEKVAKRTVGFSGADLENVLNEAAILAARLGKKAIDASDIEEAATKVKLGPEKKRLQSDLDKKITAYHEAGHAIVTRSLSNMDPVHRISIVSRGLSLGHTLIPPTQDRVHETKTHLLEQAAALLGGRAAEELVFNEMTTGAASDIAQVTNLARAMVVDFGMSALGPVDLGPSRESTEVGRYWYEPVTLSPDMAAKVDEEVNRIIRDSYDRAASILKERRAKLDRVAEALLKKETLEGDEFEELMKEQSSTASLPTVSDSDQTVG